MISSSAIKQSSTDWAQSNGHSDEPSSALSSRARKPRHFSQAKTLTEMSKILNRLPHDNARDQFSWWPNRYQKDDESRGLQPPFLATPEFPAMASTGASAGVTWATLWTERHVLSITILNALTKHMYKLTNCRKHSCLAIFTEEYFCCYWYCTWPTGQRSKVMHFKFQASSRYSLSLYTYHWSTMKYYEVLWSPMKYYELLARHAIELRFTRFQGSGLCPGCWSYTCRACRQVKYSMRLLAAQFALGAPAKANVSWTLNDQRTLHETYTTLHRPCVQTRSLSFTKASQRRFLNINPCSFRSSGSISIMNHIPQKKG